MLFVQRKFQRMKTRVALAGCLCVIGLCDESLASRNNPVPSSGGPALTGASATCMDCHGSTAGGGSVQIIGAPANYQPSVIYDLIIRVADASQLGAGFQLSVENASGHVGSLIVTDATNTTINTFDSNYINHTSAGVVDSVSGWAGMGNAAEFAMQWQAPAGDVGTVTFWAAGNAINDNNSNTGDLIYLESTTATFTPGPVPTVSTWGLVAMAILVASFGTVLLRAKNTGVTEWPC